MIRVLLMLVALITSVPATAEIIRVDFRGVIDGHYPIPLVPVGSPFQGSLTYDSSAVAVTTSTFEKFYSFEGPLHLQVGGATYEAPFGASATKSQFGSKSVVFTADLEGGILFMLRFDFIAFDPVGDWQMPTDPSLFDRTSALYMSTSLMQGSTSLAIADGSLVTPSVPEPSTWILLIIGFLGIGCVMRCRGTVSQILRRTQRPLIAVHAA